MAVPTKTFESSNVTVQSILGKLFVVSDIPALTETGTPNKTKVLSLVAGGAVVVTGGYASAATNAKACRGCSTCASRGWAACWPRGC